VLRLLEPVELPDSRDIGRQAPARAPPEAWLSEWPLPPALAGKPDLLIADDRQPRWDVTVQVRILDIYKHRPRRKASSASLSHDWGVIADSCDSAMYYAGQKVEEGEIDELFAEPRHPTPAALTSKPVYASQHVLRWHQSVEFLPPGNWPHGVVSAARCSFVTQECVEHPVPVAGGRITHRVRSHPP